MELLTLTWPARSLPALAPPEVPTLAVTPALQSDSTMKLSHLAQGAAEGAVAQAESAAEEGAARAKEEALAKAREAAWSNLKPYLVEVKLRHGRGGASVSHSSPLPLLGLISARWLHVSGLALPSYVSA